VGKKKAARAAARSAMGAGEIGFRRHDTGREPAGQTAGPAPPQAAPAPPIRRRPPKNLTAGRPSRIAQRIARFRSCCSSAAPRRAAPPWRARLRQQDRHGGKKKKTSAPRPATTFKISSDELRLARATPVRSRSERQKLKISVGDRRPVAVQCPTVDEVARRAGAGPRPLAAEIQQVAVSCPQKSSSVTCFQPGAVVSLGGKRIGWPNRY